MKVCHVLVGFAVGCATTVFATTALMPEQDPAEMAEFQKIYEKYMSPGEEHAELAKLAGEWQSKLTFWETPDAAAQSAEGPCQFEILLDGRYVLQHFESEFEGMPFEGYGLMAYDRLGEKYQSIWIDNFGTGIMYSEGKAKGSAITFKGYAPDFRKGKYVPTRSVQTQISDDSFTFEMYAPDENGKEFKSMVITYTRN